MDGSLDGGGGGGGGEREREGRGLAFLLLFLSTYFVVMVSIQDKRKKMNFQTNIKPFKFMEVSVCPTSHGEWAPALSPWRTSWSAF